MAKKTPPVVDIDVRDDLFAAAYRCVSTDEVRYSLHGVYIEPHADGATLTATDGHRLVTILDRTGRCSKAAIVTVGNGFLKACRSGEPGHGRLQVQAEFAQVSEFDVVIAWQPKPVIDGTYPDYRKVIPKKLPQVLAASMFNGMYLGSFGQIGCDLSKAFDREDMTGMVLFSAPEHSPSVALWPGIDDALGVLMPMRIDNPLAFPAFVHPAEPAP